MSAKPPRRWIEHHADWRDAPMAYWVHVEQADVPWRDATGFVPPAPTPRGRAGYAVLCVEVGAHVLAFSAPAQLDEAIRVLSMTPLPTTRRLSLARQALSPGAAATPRATRERARVAHGPNSHWLSRLPAALKSTKGRLRVVAALRDARAAAVRGDRFLDPA